MPVHHKPKLYDSLSVLMLAGLREIMLITAPADQASFRTFLGDGSDWEVNVAYAVQPDAEGQSPKICYPEDSVWRIAFIDSPRLEAIAVPLGNSGYGDDLMQRLSSGSAAS